MPRIFGSGKNSRILLEKNVGRDYTKPLRNSRPMKPHGAREAARAEKRRRQMEDKDGKG